MVLPDVFAGGLVVECYHVTASCPCWEWIVVRGSHSGSFWIHASALEFVVPHESKRNDGGDGAHSVGDDGRYWMVAMVSSLGILSSLNEDISHGFPFTAHILLFDDRGDDR